MLTECSSELEMREDDTRAPIDQNPVPNELKEEEEAKLPDGDQDFYQG